SKPDSSVLLSFQESAIWPCPAALAVSSEGAAGGVGASTASEAVLSTPRREAVKVTVSVVVTAWVVISNGAELCPAATVTLAGALTAGLLVLSRVREIANPPAGAALL